jgi:Flavin containing amine oxidoreductase
VHYFASRRGFHAPGADSGERDAVFTWPEGNAWLVKQLAAPLRERLLCGRTVLRIEEGKHAVQVLALDESHQRVEAWTAARVIVALPLHVAARMIANPPAALIDAARHNVHAPWLVANLLLDGPLLDRVGAPPSWDNVIYASPTLGYVDALHQSLRPVPGPTVLTVYDALLPAQRAALLERPWQTWAQHMMQPLLAAHPDLPRRVQRVDLMRWGHAMALPLPGMRSRTSLPALRALRGRLRFAHSDLAAYSVFEEAFIAGHEAGLR